MGTKEQWADILRRAGLTSTENLLTYFLAIAASATPSLAALDWRMAIISSLVAGFVAIGLNFVALSYERQTNKFLELLTRAAKTFVATFLGAAGVTAVGDVIDIYSLDWNASLNVAAIATIISILRNITGLQVVKEEPLEEVELVDPFILSDGSDAFTTSSSKSTYSAVGDYKADVEQNIHDWTRSNYQVEEIVFDYPYGSNESSKAGR